MHITKPTCPRVVLRNAEGHQWTYPSLHALAALLPEAFIRRWIGTHWATDGGRTLSNFGCVFYTVCDQWGDAITPETLIEALPHHRPKHRGRRRRSAWGQFRSPRTTQERRWVHAWDDERDAPRVRAARNTYNLPNAWDDYHAHAERCWKRHRKTQYRPVRP